MGRETGKESKVLTYSNIKLRNFVEVKVIGVSNKLFSKHVPPNNH
jgi:hypothetical protein